MENLQIQNFVCLRTTSGPPLFWPTTFELCGPDKDQLGTLLIDLCLHIKPVQPRENRVNCTF